MRSSQKKKEVKPNKWFLSSNQMLSPFSSKAKQQKYKNNNKNIDNFAQRGSMCFRAYGWCRTNTWNFASIHWFLCYRYIQVDWKFFFSFFFANLYCVYLWNNWHMMNVWERTMQRGKKSRSNGRGRVETVFRTWKWMSEWLRRERERESKRTLKRVR